jgi:2-C-methyl-D-erythritol 2,4-cyclodiphosphate synthase
MLNLRVGFGYDVHRLQEGLPLVLGGVSIPHSKGIVAHSDGDVILHALCDALLGAAALGDIGMHFPDTDPAWKGADSSLLLKEVIRLLEEKGYQTGNIDITLRLEKPKISGFVPEMCKHISAICKVPEDAVSVKATTEEKLGFIGHEEGVAAYAVVMIFKTGQSLV